MATHEWYPYPDTKPHEDSGISGGYIVFYTYIDGDGEEMGECHIALFKDGKWQIEGKEFPDSCTITHWTYAYEVEAPF